jgi:cell wall-associated NlpC family hydrolase
VITREQIVAEARTWLRTPHRWNQSAKGGGCDCKGLIVGVARELGLPEAQTIHARIHNYTKRFRPADLIAGLRASMLPVATPEPGDVLCYLMGNGRVLFPRHLAILTERGTIIHSYGGGIEKVAENALPDAGELHSCWTWPSLRGTDG